MKIESANDPNQFEFGGKQKKRGGSSDRHEMPGEITNEMGLPHKSNRFNSTSIYVTMKNNISIIDNLDDILQGLIFIHSDYGKALFLRRVLIS